MKDFLINAMGRLSNEDVYRDSKMLLSNGYTRSQILTYLNEGMSIVGKKYENGDYFLADLIYAGMIYNNVLAIPEMNLDLGGGGQVLGTAVVGTVEGDIHDIGKNILISMMRANNIKVIDLGVDVTADMFISAVKEYKPQILALSGLMSFSYEKIQQINELLVNEGLRDRLKMIIGGTKIFAEAYVELGADAYARDAIDGVDACKKFLSEL